MTTMVVPPNDVEKYNYVKGSQHRWFFWLHAATFIGIAVSLYGFSRMQYWTLIFLLPLLVYAGETLLGLRTSTFRRSVTLTDHLFVVETWRPVKYPSVDVYLPTAGEPIDVLCNTYKYVERLEYPGDLKIYVLDDSGRDDVRRAARAYGFEYFARPGSEFKKAGNLQYAFERTQGDHIVIFDADFVPRAEFLLETVPYMDQPEVGIVQTPQYFPTPRKMHWLERGAGATQEMFYRFIQVSRDSVNAAICCGTSAVYRRSALKECIDGFPRIAHSEDVFTGLELAKRSFRLQYVPVNLSQGICPEDLNSFITQQYRWCEGSMELAADPEFHTHPNLTSKQRLSFWSGFFYYGTTAMNGFFAPIPILIMVVLYPQYVQVVDFLPLMPLVALWLVVYPLVMRTRWRLDVIRVQMIYSFTHAVAIFDVFWGRAAEWVPSGGSGRATPLAQKVRRLIVGYLGTTSLLVIAATTWRVSQPEYTLANWWACVAFLAINAYVFLPVIALAAGITTTRQRPVVRLTSRTHNKVGVTE